MGGPAELNHFHQIWQARVRVRSVQCVYVRACAARVVQAQAAARAIRVRFTLLTATLRLSNRASRKWRLFIRARYKNFFVQRRVVVVQEKPQV